MINLLHEVVISVNEENNEENNADNDEDNDANDEVNDEENEPEPEPEETFTEITPAAAGDIMAHSTQNDSAYENGGGSYDFKPMFEDVKSILIEADLTLANFETTTGGADLG